jgi:Spy/CpxP family protein refolding chaperone
MKSTLRLLISLATLAMFLNTGSARAEEASTTSPAPSTSTSTAKKKRGNKRGEQAGGSEQQLVKNLDLTAEQKTKVAAITKKAAVDVKAISGDTALSAKEKRSKTTAIRDAARADIRALLTPEQQAKFDKAVTEEKTTQAIQRKKGGKRKK